MKKILVIDDCEFEREVFKEVLSKMNNNKVETSSEINVYEKIKTTNPDIIIVNLIMEEITGDKLIEDIKSNYPELKCILSSSNPIQLKDYKEKKVDAVFRTPIEEDRLRKVLNKFDLPENGKAREKKEEKFSFCPYCGGEFAEKKEFAFCPYCGKEL